MKILNQNLEKNFYKIIIDFPRPKLIERINYRTEEIFKNGRNIRGQKVSKGLKYQKIKAYLKLLGYMKLSNI